MTARYDDDRLLSAWLHDRAPSREPEHLLGEVLARTARTRRRPAWRNPERLHLMSAITSRFAPAAPVPWRLLAAAALVLVAIAAGAVLVASGALRAPAPPYGLAANGPLYYSDNGKLYVRTADAKVRELQAGTDPVLSPDGTRLSFLRHGDSGKAELWTMKADGSGLHQLALPSTSIRWFEWSPTADAAVVLLDDDDGAMTVMPVDGGTLARFDLHLAIDEPVFRPSSGAQISFLGADSSGNHGIYVIGRDGTGLRMLDLDPGFRNDPSYENDKAYYFQGQSWSPTGELLLYTQLEPDPPSPAGAGFRMHLAKVDASGAVVSDRVLEFDRQSDDEGAGSWLPGVDGMVYERIEGLVHTLWFAPFDGSAFGTARSLDIEATDWMAFQASPDGSTALVVMPAAEGEKPVVYLVDIASGRKTQVDIGADAVWQRLSR